MRRKEVKRVRIVTHWTHGFGHVCGILARWPADRLRLARWNNSCGMPRLETRWQAHSLDTGIRSGLWDSRQMASGSSQARTMKQFVCGTPRLDTRWQAHSLDTRMGSILWDSRQMASASSQARTMEQFVCGTPRLETRWQAHLLDKRIR